MQSSYYFSKEDITKATEVIQNGGIILYPTDTIWGIGGDAANPEVIAKIYKLKKRDDAKSLVSLVSNMEMLEEITSVSDQVKNTLASSDRPTTVIYDSVLQIHKSAVADDGSAAIRICSDAFCNALIQQLKTPLLSTSANISGEPSPTCYNRISGDIKKGVDWIATHRRDEITSGVSSRILKITASDIIIIRE